MEKEIWAGFLVDLTQDRFSNISNFPNVVFNHIENIFARTILKIVQIMVLTTFELNL